MEEKKLKKEEKETTVTQSVETRTRETKTNINVEPIPSVEAIIEPMGELTKTEKKRFSLIARVRSANHAWRGIRIIFASGHNIWGFIFFAVMCVYLGIILNVSEFEWLILILTIAMVFITEALNTAMEIDMDLTSPNFHPYARDTKDVAAGASLLAVFFSIIIGTIIFVPKIYGLYFY